MSRLHPIGLSITWQAITRQDSNGAQNLVTAMFEISDKKAAELWYSNPITKPPT
jgi:hypothetical protein